MVEPVGLVLFADPTFNLIATLPFDKSRKDLITTVLRNKIKITPEKVIDIWELAARQVPGVNSSIIWIEQGRHDPVTQVGDGYIHIRERHLHQFEDKGIAGDQIPGLAMAATSNGWIVATKGAKRGRQSATCIYVLEFQGKILAVAILVADNGYIVTMHPFDWSEMLKLARKRLDPIEMKVLESRSPN